MFRRNKQTRKYQAPHATVTEVHLEGCICLSAFMKVQVDELHNINSDSDAAAAEEVYFEF